MGIEVEKKKKSAKEFQRRGLAAGPLTVSTVCAVLLSRLKQREPRYARKKKKADQDAQTIMGNMTFANTINHQDRSDYISKKSQPFCCITSRQWTLCLSRPCCSPSTWRHTSRSRRTILPKLPNAACSPSLAIRSAKT